MQVRPKGTLSNNKQHRELTEMLVSWLLQEVKRTSKFCLLQLYRSVTSLVRTVERSRRKEPF